MWPRYRGLYRRFADSMDVGANLRVHATSASLLADLLPGIADVIPGYTSLYLEYDQKLTEKKVRSWLGAHVGEADPDAVGKSVKIPVLYDGEDLDEVAGRTGLTRGEVIARHSAPLYRVYAVGFAPGYPFMGEVEPSLRVPRRATPRARVPAHSVALANAQTGIYPLASPGGWNLLGRALKKVYDPHRENAFLLEPGDTVRFLSSTGSVPEEPEVLELLPRGPRYPVFKVLEPGLLDLVVDEGRFLAGRLGLSRSGPLDPRSARQAGALLGNRPDAPLLEMNLRGATLEALASAVAAFAGYGMVPVINGEKIASFAGFALEKGDVLSFAPSSQGSRGYLAVAGGFESDTFLESASVDLKSRIGRALEPGDVLGLKELRPVRPGFSFTPHVVFCDPAILRIRPGPQASAEALEALAQGLFTVTSADRMGIRFDGPAVPGGEVMSEAVPLGAVQVTPGGAPILLLNDRGTLGGYAKPALLDPEDLPKAAQLRPGSRVRFSAPRTPAPRP